MHYNSRLLQARCVTERPSNHQDVGSRLSSNWKHCGFGFLFFLSLPALAERKRSCEHSILLCIMSPRSLGKRDPEGLGITSSRPARTLSCRCSSAPSSGEAPGGEPAATCCTAASAPRAPISCDLMQLKTPPHLTRTRAHKHTGE